MSLLKCYGCGKFENDLIEQNIPLLNGFYIDSICTQCDRQICLECLLDDKVEMYALECNDVIPIIRKLIKNNKK